MRFDLNFIICVLFINAIFVEANDPKDVQNGKEKSILAKKPSGLTSDSILEYNTCKHCGKFNPVENSTNSIKNRSGKRSKRDLTISLLDFRNVAIDNDDFQLAGFLTKDSRIKTFDNNAPRFKFKFHAKIKNRNGGNRTVVIPLNLNTAKEVGNNSFLFQSSLPSQVTKTTKNVEFFPTKEANILQAESSSPSSVTKLAAEQRESKHKETDKIMKSVSNDLMDVKTDQNVKGNQINYENQGKRKGSISITGHPMVQKYLKDRIYFPWQRFITNDGFKHFCPSVVLNKQFLLVANSCMDKFEPAELHSLFICIYHPSQMSMKNWKFFKSRSPIIEKMMPHPKYNKRPDGEIENDLMIVRTSPHIFERNEPTVPICLPKASNHTIGNKLIQFFWIEPPSQMSKPIAILTEILDNDKEQCDWNVKHQYRFTPMRRLCTIIRTIDNNCPQNQEAKTSGYLSRYDWKSDRLILIGLFSYGESTCFFTKSSTEVAIFTRIDQYIDWIVPIIQTGKCS